MCCSELSYDSVRVYIVGSSKLRIHIESGSILYFSETLRRYVLRLFRYGFSILIYYIFVTEIYDMFLQNANIFMEYNTNM